MDSAKFCGNCGTPFPRSPVPSSSLVNCPQGHIYSAVYEHCPYCPLPETAVVSDPVPANADFATKVEAQEPAETIAEMAAVKTPDIRAAEIPRHQSREETVIESIETAIGDASIEPTILTPHDITRVEPPPKRTKDQEPAKPQKVSSSALTVEKTATSEGPDKLANASSSAVPPPPPPAPKPVKEPVATDQADRRTVIMETPIDPQPKGRGKIVGWLITYTTNNEGTDFRLRAGHNRLGAHPACDLVIDDETVSGSHAVIVHRDGRCLIKDDLSRNGTFVNGVEITEARALQNYDEIRVGNTTLIFVSAERTK